MFLERTLLITKIVTFNVLKLVTFTYYKQFERLLLNPALTEMIKISYSRKRVRRIKKSSTSIANY